MRGAALFALALCAGAASAEPPQSSIRPQERVGAAQVTPVQQSAPAPQTSSQAWYDVQISPRPRQRTEEIIERARSAGQRLAGQGGLCGDPRLDGDYLDVVGGPGRCGIEDAVKLRAVSGVPLSRPASIDCETARTLRQWVDAAKPIVGNEGGGIASLRVIASYSCRNRRGTSNVKLSEHALGRAIDIAGIGLRDGTEISVLDGWDTRDDGAQLRQMHDVACGPFGTVLGPEANAAHHNHFHFDTARYRSGSYCR